MRKLTNIRPEKIHKKFTNIRLKGLREAAGLSQSDLGGKIGLSGQAIYSYESGRRRLTADAAKKLADFFGCSIGYLLYEDGTDSPDTSPYEASAASLLAIAAKIADRPSLGELLSVAQGVDDDMLEAATAMLRTYMQRKSSKKE